MNVCSCGRVGKILLISSLPGTPTTQRGGALRHPWIAHEAWVAPGWRLQALRRPCTDPPAPPCPRRSESDQQIADFVAKHPATQRGGSVRHPRGAHGAGGVTWLEASSSAKALPDLPAPPCPRSSESRQQIENAGNRTTEGSFPLMHWWSTDGVKVPC